jgi:UDP-2-acetamido-2-deoxy-ribo-hexuluronate aminotransferase
VQTLHYVCAKELGRMMSIPFKDGLAQARALLKIFSAYVQWLPALSEDGEVWDAEDPEDEQLKKAFSRLGEGALFVSRDLGILGTTAGTLSPEEAFEVLKAEATQLHFVDLSAQRDHMRPELQNRLFSVVHSNKFINGPDVGKLAEELAAYSGVSYAFPCSSGTDALLLAMLALGEKVRLDEHHGNYQLLPGKTPRLLRRWRRRSDR